MIRIYACGEVPDEEIFSREVGAPGDLRETVSAILDDVRVNGDRALFAYAKKFDKAELTDGFMVRVRRIHRRGDGKGV